MRKLSIKTLLFSVMAMLGLGGALFITNHQYASAQGTVQLNNNTFGDVSNTAGIGLTGTGQDQGESLITIIKNFINRVLGILGLIALVVLLYGGFNMVTAAGDEDKYNKGFTILKQAAMGLVFIGLAFFMVSMIFWLIGVGTGENTAQ